MEYLDAAFQYFGYENFHEFAFWVAKNPYEFLISVMIVLTPMFIISGILAFYLLKAIEKEEKEKKKREKRLQNIKDDQDPGEKPKSGKKAKGSSAKKGKKSQKAD